VLRNSGTGTRSLAPALAGRAADREPRLLAAGG